VALYRILSGIFFVITMLCVLGIFLSPTSMRRRSDGSWLWSDYVVRFFIAGLASLALCIMFSFLQP